MLEILKELHPIAKKEHECMFCRCMIQKGEQYQRDTIKYDERIYDFINHEECMVLARKLDMFNTDSDGVDEYAFLDNLQQYVDFYYRDKETDDLPEDMVNLSLIELVRKILADYDKPFIKKRRLMTCIEELEWRKKHRVLSSYDIKRLEEYYKELKTLEG